MEKKMRNILRSTFFAASIVSMSISMPQIAYAAAAVNTCSTGAGPTDDYYYANYAVGGSGCIDTRRKGSSYIASWDLKSKGNSVAGLGWEKGSSSRKAGYKVNGFSEDGTNYISLYGWTEGSLIEYYVVDIWGDYRPTFGKSLGTVKSDGGTYDIYVNLRKDGDNITRKKQDFLQYWSVRREKAAVRKDNVITFSNHVNKWASTEYEKGKKMQLGKTWRYQVIATESYGGGGNLKGASDVTVSEK
jgi:endo-1,4-beta-xylanase